ncbi:MAG: YcaO-like family protein [Chloroflexota bacterium]
MNRTVVKFQTEALYQQLENQLVDNQYGLVKPLQICYPNPGEPQLWITRAWLSYYDHDLGMNQFKLVGGGSSSSDKNQAKISALCESVERYCLHANQSDIIVDSYENLSKRFHLLNPADCPIFHPDQYPEVGFAEFTAVTKIAWAWTVALPEGTPVLVPAEFVYLRHPAHPEASTLMPTISTGAACGSSATDAVVRGIYEIVERDAMMIMWFNQHSAPRVKVDLQSDLGKFIHQNFRSPNLSPHLFWLATDLNIPAVMAILIEGQQSDDRVVYVGLSAHLNPEQAVEGALREAIEIRKSTQLARPNMKRPLNTPEDVTTIYEHAHYYIEKDQTHLLDFLLTTPHTIDLSTVPNRATGNPQADLKTCLSYCAKVGQPVFAADITKEDIRQTGLCIVRVVMPKMQRLTSNHNKPFLGNPRPFTLPVQLGWRPAPLSRAEINQAPHPFG